MTTNFPTWRLTVSASTRTLPPSSSSSAAITIVSSMAAARSCCPLLASTRTTMLRAADNCRALPSLPKLSDSSSCADV